MSHNAPDHSMLTGPEPIAQPPPLPQLSLLQRMSYAISEYSALLLALNACLTGLLTIVVLVLLCVFVAFSNFARDVTANRKFRVEVSNRSLDVEVSNRSLDVEIQNTQPIDVEVTNRLPMEVKLRDHYIIDADPIPVRIVR